MSARKNKSINYSGRYSIVSTLGKGSYGNVYEALPIKNIPFSKSKYKTVAIKYIPDVFSSRTMAKRTLREIRILHCCKHPNILKILDLIPHNKSFARNEMNALSIVVECMECDLKDILSSDQFFTKGHIQYILYQIFCALNHMHQMHICHRDLKPANILINADCDIRVCDFGLSKFFDPESSDEPDSEISSTTAKKKSGKMTNHVVTRWYRAPEIILLSQNARTLPLIDIWALGCITGELYTMLPENESLPSSRQPLFPGSACYPLSPAKKNRKNREKDQLAFILNLVGTPTEDDCTHIVREDARSYLNSFPIKSPISWQERFPGSDKHAIDLLESMLQFDVQKRITALQGMKHRFVSKFRSRKRETQPKPLQYPNDSCLEMHEYKREMKVEVKHIAMNLKSRNRTRK